jgi:hypothetical protein
MPPLMPVRKHDRLSIRLGLAHQCRLLLEEPLPLPNHQCTPYRVNRDTYGTCITPKGTLLFDSPARGFPEAFVYPVWPA